MHDETVTRIVPIYEAKKDSMYQDFVVPCDNPFDAGKSIVGLGNRKSRNRYHDTSKKLSSKTGLFCSKCL